MEIRAEPLYCERPDYKTGSLTANVNVFNSGGDVKEEDRKVVWTRKNFLERGASTLDSFLAPTPHVT